MFCPSCGSDERQGSQYCRACGTDLRPVRLSLEHPDSVTASAVTAREEIGRAVAAKIRDVHDARELKKVAEDVLPQIEKFLESPEEKRLRRMRVGTIISTIGLGATIGMLMISLVSDAGDRQGFMMTSALGMVCFFIGLGFLLNAFFFTRPRKDVSDHSADAQAQNILDSKYNASSQLRPQTTSNLVQPPGSVTENTTLHLKSER
jgi:uncharacterized membrane protein YeaQ/YmgE (transglycosylase-associated protein family)